MLPISQANVAESLGWMTRQSPLLSFFHYELDKPSPTADLKKKLQSNRASIEKQIQTLAKERDELKISQSALRSELATAASNFDQLKLENYRLAEEKKEVQGAL
jgi:septal ring factor EnvC (AmiA/AmiB activator)